MDPRRDLRAELGGGCGGDRLLAASQKVLQWIGRPVDLVISQDQREASPRLGGLAQLGAELRRARIEPDREPEGPEIAREGAPSAVARSPTCAT
jgi:hypothetical protein